MAAGDYSPGGLSVESFKGNFFDAEAVLKKMDRATARVMSRFGAFVRRRAQTSIRYRLKPAPPGQPPSAHKTVMRPKTNRRTGVTRMQPSSPLRDLIFFAYSAESQTVIVGPAIFAGSHARLQPTRGTIPETLERGGVLRGEGRTLFMAQAAGRNSAGRFVSKGKRAVRLRGNISIAARPFMGPALEAELPKLAPMYANSL